MNASTVLSPAMQRVSTLLVQGFQKFLMIAGLVGSIDNDLVGVDSTIGADTALHVSAGIGTSPYAPLRFCCRPEATLLTLVASPTGGRDENRSVVRSTPTASVR